MAKTLNNWTRQVKKLAFKQINKLQSLGTDCFGLLKNKDHKHHAPSLSILTHWLATPFTMWRFDLWGSGRAHVERIKNGEPIDPRYVRLLEKIEQLPPTSTQERVAKHEFDIQAGNYAKFLINQAKYDAMERDLANNPAVMRDWNEIKSLFDVTLYRSPAGIIRHTHLLDRGYRPPHWEYRKAEDKEKWLFYAFFDCFCIDHCLLGMEYDRPLLQRLTVIRTEFGTQVTFPRYMSVNPGEDLNWAEFQEVHKDEAREWQGPKASEGQSAKKEMLRKFHAAHQYAEAQGWKGDKRWGYVEQECDLRPNTDRGTLRRLRRQAYDLWEEENA